MQTSMALEEALANAFYHGSLGLDSQLKADGSNRFSQLARERCGQLPWMDRRVTIKELATPFGVWITIRDQGCGFDVSAAWTRAEGTLNTLASGRGLVMMRAFTDDLIYNETGNEVTLVVYNSRNQDVADLLKNRAAARHKKSEQSSDL